MQVTLPLAQLHKLVCRAIVKLPDPQAPIQLIAENDHIMIKTLDDETIVAWTNNPIQCQPDETCQGQKGAEA